MRYKGSMRLQAGRQEKIQDMYSMVKERLSNWRNKYKSLPSNILFYRDGVSETQFETCETHEIPAIRQAYKDLAPDNDDSKLCITFVVVVKRHHTRFYNTADPYVGDEKTFQRRKLYNSNYKPGLLVTEVVTNPKPPNFFLQSHSSPQGSARPTHYHILHDGINLGMERLPEITNVLCYASARATSALLYVAPTYIADRLCARGMHYLGPWKDVTSDLGPWFRLSREARKMMKEEIVAEKQAFAVKLNKRLVRDSTGEWDIWETDEEEGNGGQESQRLNPWHPNLDGEMFWL